jgi:hypothetical protein
MKGGENEMQSLVTYQLWLAIQRRDEQIREAARDRRFAQPSPSIRRAVGTSIIRLGTRLAGEPTYELARSR